MVLPRVFSKSGELVDDCGVAHCVAQGGGDVGGAGQAVDADGEVADAGHGVGGVAGAHL